MNSWVTHRHLRYLLNQTRQFVFPSKDIIDFKQVHSCLSCALHLLRWFSCRHGLNLDDESTGIVWIRVSLYYVSLVPSSLVKYHDCWLVNKSLWNASRTRKNMCFPVIFIRPLRHCISIQNHSLGLIEVSTGLGPCLYKRNGWRFTAIWLKVQSPMGAVWVCAIIISQKSEGLKFHALLNMKYLLIGKNNVWIVIITPPPATIKPLK